MTGKDYDLNLWEKNYVQIPAVQGEGNSRTVNFHLKEEVNTQNALGNLELRLKPIDITNCSVRIYFEKPDGTKVFSDGTVSDATNGVATFALPRQASTAAGIASGQILITKLDGTVLKGVGIDLDISASDLDGALESTSEYSALVTALNKADTAATTATQAAADAQKAVSDAQSAVSTANQASTTATTAAQTANTAADRANTAAGDTEKMYQMVDPTTGKTDYVTNIIKNLEAYIFSGAITASQLDGLNLTAQAFDAKNITARNFDTSAKTILGVA